jgi:hypothetical protein
MSNELTFKQYYEHYLTLHQNKWCRRLHVVGQFATILFVVLCVFYKIWPLLLLTPFVVYPFAWTGHFVFEKNRPAAFKKPLWAKACDWIMLKDIITGKISF